MSKEVKMTFARRPGTAGAAGQKYEVHLLALLLWEATHRKYSFHLATNMAEAGDFDDVVLRYSSNDSATPEHRGILFLQAKHRENASKEIILPKLLSTSDKGDFLLKKYFAAFRDIKRQFSSGNIAHPILGNHFDDCQFVIFTNSLRGFSDSDDNFTKHSVKKDNILWLEENQHFYTINLNGSCGNEIVESLQNASESKKLVKELIEGIFSKEGVNTDKGLLRTHHAALAAHVIRVIEPKKGQLTGNENDAEWRDGFKAVLLEELRKRPELDGKTPHELEIKIPVYFGKVRDPNTNPLPFDVVTDDEIQEFTAKVKLFIGQPNQRGLGEIIKERIGKTHKLDSKQLDASFCTLANAIENWWMSEDQYLTEQTTIIDECLRGSVYFNVKKPLRLFTGREDRLHELHGLLGSGECVVSISGLGGIGKTETVRKYLHEYSSHYGHLIWMDAESENSLSDCFFRLAEEHLGIELKEKEGKDKSMDRIVSEVYRCICDRKTLIVFDNADEREVLRKYLPPRVIGISVPSVVITSRNREWGRGVQVIDLNCFSQEEAVRFIETALGDLGDNEEREQLSTKLQQFPLALHQAVEYIQEQIVVEDYSIGQYLKDLEKQQETLLDFDKFQDLDGDYFRTTYSTWNITVDKIRGKESYGELSGDILDSIAYLAPDNIPRELFSNLAQGDDSNLKLAVRLLVRYSMISGEKHQSLLSAHRLVQKVTRLGAKRTKKEVEILDRTLKLLRDKIDRRLLPHATCVWSFARQYDFLVQKHCCLVSEIINALYKEAKFVEGYNFGKSALNDLIGVCGPRHNATLGANKVMAGFLVWQDKHDEALDVLKDILRHERQNIMALSGMLNDDIKYILMAAEEVLGPSQRNISEKVSTETSREDIKIKCISMAKTLKNIANIFNSKGYFDKALSIYEALHDTFILYEEINSDYSHLLHQMGLVCGRLGRYDRALALYRKAIDVELNINDGENNPQTALTLNNMGIIYDTLGQYDKALDIYQQVLDILHRMYAKDNPNVLRTRHNIAMIHYRLGHYEQAFQMCEDIVQHSSRVLGPKHSATLYTQAIIGHIYQKNGDSEQALKIYKEIYKQRKIILGGEHPRVLQMQLCIAEVMATQKKYTESLEILKVVRDGLLKSLGPDHPHKLASDYQMANVLMELGQLSAASELFEEVCERYQKSLGPEHPDTLQARHGYTELLRKQGKITKALSILEDIYNKRKAAVSSEHPDTLKMLEDMKNLHELFSLESEKVYNPKKTERVCNVLSVFFLIGLFCYQIVSFVFFCTRL